MNLNEELVNCENLEQAMNLIDKNDFEFNWEEALYAFCKKGSYELVKLVLAKGSKFDWNKAFDLTSRINILDLIVRKEHKFNWNSKLQEGCLKGNDSLVNFVLNKGSQQGYVFDWNEAMRSSCEGNNRHLALRMIDLGANDWTS